MSHDQLARSCSQIQAGVRGENRRTVEALQASSSEYPYIEP